jgi:hypothetical protein
VGRVAVSADLLAQLEGSTSGSAELDWLIMEEFGPKGGGIPAHYTTSIDAAVALCERLLPEWSWQVGYGHGGKGWGVLEQPDTGAIRETVAPTPALALCRAIVAARSVQ